MIVEKWFDTPVCPVWLERKPELLACDQKTHAQCTKELLSELSNHMILVNNL